MPLAEALRRHCQSLWRRRGTLREWLRRAGLKREDDTQGQRSSEARAHFWAELRQGQMEAEALAQRSNERRPDEASTIPAAGK